jgi:MYXO-CTERM domain-containing protein
MSERPLDSRYGPPSGETAVLVAVQSGLSAPPLVSTSRALSHFGEHAAGWVGVAAVGAALSRRRRRDMLLVGVGALAAHAAAIAIKLVVRRARPDHPAVTVNAGTPSALSFPSAHATSSTAAAMLLCRATGSRLPLVLIPVMALSRLVLGVHYPTDVLAGIAVGAPVAGATSRLAGPRKETPSADPR